MRVSAASRMRACSAGWSLRRPQLGECLYNAPVGLCAFVGHDTWSPARSLRHISNELEGRIWSLKVRTPQVFECSARGYAEPDMGCSTCASSSRVPELAVLDPATGEAIGHIPACGVPEAHDAVAAARAAHGAWARTAAGGARLAAEGRGAPAARARARAGRAADARGRHAAGGRRSAASRPGSPPSRPTPSSARWSAAAPPRGDLVLREPRGVVAILMPWCDPLAATCGALAAALVTGNAVVLKPSEKAPLAARADGRAARPRRRSCSSCTATSAPRGRSATHPGVDLVIRPGEEAAGSHLAIVDAGVDPEWAARARSRRSAFAGAGQSCGSVERVHVHRALAEPFLDALARARAGAAGRPGHGPRAPSSGR